MGSHSTTDKKQDDSKWKRAFKTVIHWRDIFLESMANMYQKQSIWVYNNSLLVRFFLFLIYYFSPF